MNWEGKYPFGQGLTTRETIQDHIKMMPDEVVSPATKGLVGKVLDNWDEAKYLITSREILPFITKYLVYAHIDHPSNAVVEDMYAEAYRQAKEAITPIMPGLECEHPLTTEERMELRRQERGGWETQGVHVEGKSGYESMLDLCYIVTHPKTERLDKVLDIEAIATSRHKRGSVWGHDDSLAEIILDMLFEGQ